MGTPNSNDKNAAPEVEAMASFLDEIGEGTFFIEEPLAGLVHPTIQWINGSKKQKARGTDDIAYTGGWFISEDQGVDEAPPGFKPYVFTTDKGDEIPGYAARTLEKVVVIRDRKCWIVDPMSPTPVRFSSREYDEAVEYATSLSKPDAGPRGRLHVLIAFPSAPQDLFVLSLGGTVVSDFRGSRNSEGVLDGFRNKIVKRATRMSHQRSRSGQGGKPTDFPTCAFFLTNVGAAVDDKGAPVFETRGKGTATSTVTPPKWLDAPNGNASVDLINKLFVRDSDLRNMVQHAFNENESWSTAWYEEPLAEQRSRLIKKTSTEVQASTEGGRPDDQEMGF